ncbi:hypothetical protein ACOMHN_018036 [Nucella lapillus]
MPDMSEKKSPPQKEKPVVVGTLQTEGRAIKRKLLTPDPVDDEADKKVTAKRKRPLGFDASSPDPGNSSSPRGASGNVRSHGVPLSERQQMALLLRMTDETSQGDTSPKPSSPPPSVTSTKRTPADKKVNKRNERGETPLHLAAKRGDLKQARRLIKAGASVNVTDYAGWTPLHEACNLGNVDVAKQLLKAGANVNVLGLGDETPLHDAAINSHGKLVGILLKHGANPLQANVKGQTPVDVAHEGHIKKLLNREVISSHSETSSIDEVRSPTSPESLASIKDDDRVSEVEEIKPRSSSMSMVKGDNSTYPLGSLGSRRMSLPPKSPVDKPLPSPRLFLKFKSAGSSSGEEAGPNQGQSHRKSTDSKEPMFKSYILTMDTGDQQQQQQHQQQHQQQQHLHQMMPTSHHPHYYRERGMPPRGSGRPSPACSPVSSMEVEEVRRDYLSGYADHHPHHLHPSHHPHPHPQHNQHHNKLTSSSSSRGGDHWDNNFMLGGGGGGGGGGQNNVSSLPSAAPPSSSSSLSLPLPSLKVQCVRPDSSEEESGVPSSQGAAVTPLQRLRTEPFTPQPLEEVSDDDDHHRAVFRTGVRTPQQRLHSAPSSRLLPSMGGGGGSNSGLSQHIPASGEAGVNHHTTTTTTPSPSPSSTGRHRVSQGTGGVVDVPLVCVSRTGGVTSTTGSMAPAASCVDKDSLIAPPGPDRTSQPTSHSGRRSNGGGVSGGGGGVSGGSGSSMCVNNSSGMMGVSGAVSSGSVGVSHTNMSTSFPTSSSTLPSTSQLLRWDMARARTDRSSPKTFPGLDFLSAEKSDSSASSPLRMDIDENLSSSSPRSDRDNESRPSCPKVPPLKIILPSQKASATPHAPDQTKHPLSKPALPYVLNPSAGQWTMDMADEGATRPPGLLPPLQEDNSLTVNTLSPHHPPSHPASRTGSNEREENRNSSSGKVGAESSSLLPREELTSNGKEEEEERGEGEEEEEHEEESRPTRTLRSHTAMKQQQEQKQQKTGDRTKGDPGKDDKGSKADSKEAMKGT